LTFDPIETPNVAATAAAQIRKLIANDVLRPGDQLPGERDLATRMGISRNLSFRRMIEGQSAAFVAANATKAEKDHILAIHAQLQSAVAHQDGQKLQDLDQEFSQSHEATYGSSQGPQDILEQHQVIVDAIIAGDPSQAQGALVEHLNHFEQLIVKSKDAKERAEIVQKRTAWNAQT